MNQTSRRSAVAATGGEAPTLFARIAATANLDRPAIISPDGQLTYAELLERADRLARCFVGGHAPVLVYGHKQPAVVAAFLAALQRGRPYVPADPSLPTSRVVQMVEAARPGVVVAALPLPAELTAELTRRGIPVLAPGALVEAIEPDRLAREAGRADEAQDRADTPVYIMFTSGTTGEPKGVLIPVSGLAHFTAWLLEVARVAPGAETFLNQAPFNFDLSVMDLYGALLTGGTLFCVTREEIADPRLLFRRLDGAPVTVWVSTPSFARFCLAEPRFARELLPALRCFLFCGETLPPAVVRELHQRFPGAAVWNTYGPTEATVAVTAVQVTAAMAASDHPLPVGRPALGMDVWIADPAEAQRRLPDGTSGEIVIAGPQVALGYLPAARSDTSETGRQPFLALSDGGRAYRTGDLGHIDSTDGLLYCEGRLDRQVKLHGYRLELEEIETRLRRVPGVGDAAVLVVERGGRPDHLVAFVVPAGDPSAPAVPAESIALTQAMRAALAEHLPTYALPRAVHLLPTPPLTANGKLDRRALHALR